MADAETPNLGLNDLKDAASLAQKRKELESFRTDEMREWRLNREFYKGNQWVFPNRFSGRIEAPPIQEGENPRYKVRLTSNQIAPGVNHLVALLTKNRPVIHASPDTSSDRDIQAAKFAESLYDHLWTSLNLGSKLQTSLVHAALSQGYWKINWDPLAGKRLTQVIDPSTGQPVEGTLADMLLEEADAVAQEQGIDPSAVRAQVTKTAYVGDISVEAMPGENVLIDPSVTNYEDAAYVICIHNMSVDEVKARYGVSVNADATPSETGIPMAFTQRLTDNKPKTTKRVYILYVKPNPAVPQGRYVVWVENPEQILLDTKWPYPFNEIPLVKFPGIERPDSPLDMPPTSLARPIQKELNRTGSQIVEFKNMTIKPQMLAPVGSLRQRLTNEPGAVFEYQPIAGLAPEWRPQPPLPNYIFEHLADLRAQLDKVYHRIPSQRDQLPARIDSPGSIDMVQEAVADELAPQVQRLEEALARAGTMFALLAQKYYTEYRLIRVSGPNGADKAKKFLGSRDLDGGFSFRPQAGSGLPRSRWAKQAMLDGMFDRQLLDPATYFKYADIAGMDGVAAEMAADEDQAEREHEKLIRGEPINPVAVMEAQQQIQQVMMDPQADPDGDGVPDTPDQKMAWAQQTMQQAMVAPLPFENPDAHLARHGLYMKSAEFNSLALDAQKRFEDHWSATLDMSIQLRQTQAALDPKVAPNITTQLKGTMSAPVLAEILNRAGIQTTPDEVAMPPLDTWVTDDVTKPAEQETANTHLDDAQKLQAMVHASDQHQATMAKAARDNETAAQKHNHADLLLRARLRQMKAAKSGRPG